MKVVVRPVRVVDPVVVVVARRAKAGHVKAGLVRVVRAKVDLVRVVVVAVSGAKAAGPKVVPVAIVVRVPAAQVASTSRRIWISTS